MWSGGVSGPGGCCPGGSGPGGCLVPGGVWSQGGVWSGGCVVWGCVVWGVFGLGVSGLGGGLFLFDFFLILIFFGYLQPHRPPSLNQTQAYGQRATGTHPTGMHSCYNNYYSPRKSVMSGMTKCDGIVFFYLLSF